MSIETAIILRLTTDAGITALVAARIYPNIREQGSALPAIVYEQISGPREHTADGPVGLVESAFVFTIGAKTYSEVRTLADLLRQRLDGFSGVVDSVTIGEITLDNERDQPSPVPGDAALIVYSKELDFMIWFEETI